MSPSPTLKALLRYSKCDERDRSWTHVRDHVLGEMYHPEMRLADVLRVVLSAWDEAAREPRFSMPGAHANGRGLEELILAPVSGHFAMDRWPGPNLQSTYTVEQFYNAIVQRMLSDLMLTRVDWCRAEIWPEQVANAETSTAA